MNRLRVLIALTVLGCGVCAAKDTCFDCHKVMEGMSLKFTNDIHFAKFISCANCHGGDPNEPNQNISMNASRGFKLRVQRQAVPQFCGNCHSDTNVMSKFDQPRVDQFAKYTNSVHAQKLAAGTRRAAECADCHSVHDTRAVRDPLSTASPQRIAQTCGKCHAPAAQAFARSPHGRLFNNARNPGCTVCHSNHDIQPATTAMLTGSTSVCARCHRPGSNQVRLGQNMAQILSNLQAAGPESKDALERARIAVHSVNLAAVRQAAQPVAPPPGTDGN